MARAIDADEFYKKLEGIRMDYLSEDTLSSDFAAKVIELVMDEYLQKQPTIDPVKHGKWIDTTKIRWVNETNVPVVMCTECGIRFCDLINNHHYMYHYCPNCGARMDGE